MENRSRFRLEEAIARWSYDLALAGLGQEDILELESHLRDEVDVLHTSLLDDEEAFLVACHRLGTSDQLSREFAKLGPNAVVFDSILSGALLVFLGYSLIAFFTFLVLRLVSYDSVVSMGEFVGLPLGGTIAVMMGLIIFFKQEFNLPGRRLPITLVSILVFVWLGIHFALSSAGAADRISHFGFVGIYNSMLLSRFGFALLLLLVFGYLIHKARRKHRLDFLPS